MAGDDEARLATTVLDLRRQLTIEGPCFGPLELTTSKAGQLYRDLWRPVVLSLESLDLVVPLDSEPKRRCLARPIRDHSQVSVELLSAILQQLPRHQPCKGRPDLEIEFLSRVHSHGHVLVGSYKSVQRSLHLWFRQCRELCSVDVVVNGEVLAADTDDLETNALALSVAIQPQGQILSPFGELLQMLHDLQLCCSVLDGLFDACSVQYRWVIPTAFAVILVEVQAEYVADDAGLLKSALLPRRWEVGDKLIDLASTRNTLAHAHSASREMLRNHLGHAGLFCHHHDSGQVIRVGLLLQALHREMGVQAEEEIVC
mmetsp:Transcript_119453/g.266832  ORF Transcript_119453/g.266832 Transcript_119453/m.266832 type:complete len:315 (-) Transcript_119453:365-1309(-)